MGENPGYIENTDHLRNFDDIVTSFAGELQNSGNSNYAITSAISLIHDGEIMDSNPLSCKNILLQAMSIISNKEDIFRTIIRKSIIDKIDHDYLDDAVEAFYKTLLERLDELKIDCDHLINMKATKLSAGVKESLKNILVGEPFSHTGHAKIIKSCFSSRDQTVFDKLLKAVKNRKYNPTFTLPLRQKSLETFRSLEDWCVVEQNGIFGDEIQDIKDNIDIVERLGSHACLECYKRIYSARKEYKTHMMNLYDSELNPKLNQDLRIDEYNKTIRLIKKVDNKLEKNIHKITLKSVYIMVTEIKDMFQALDDDGEGYDEQGNEARGEDPKEIELEASLKESIEDIEEIDYIPRYINLYNAIVILDHSFTARTNGLESEAKKISAAIRSYTDQIDDKEVEISKLTVKSDPEGTKKTDYEKEIETLKEKINTGKKRYTSIKTQGDDTESLITQFTLERQKLQPLLKDITSQYLEYRNSLSAEDLDVYNKEQEKILRKKTSKMSLGRKALGFLRDTVTAGIVAALIRFNVGTATSVQSTVVDLKSKGYTERGNLPERILPNGSLFTKLGIDSFPEGESTYYDEGDITITLKNDYDEGKIYTLVFYHKQKKYDVHFVYGSEITILGKEESLAAYKKKVKTLKNK